jgi:hypothetical protein
VHVLLDLVIRLGKANRSKDVSIIKQSVQSSGKDNAKKLGRFTRGDGMQVSET